MSSTAVKVCDSQLRTREVENKSDASYETPFLVLDFKMPEKYRNTSFARRRVVYVNAEGGARRRS